MSGFISRRFLLILGVYVIVLGSALFWRRVVDYYSPDRFGGANANANATTTITTQAEGPIRGSEQGLTAASASTENVDQQANGQSELSSDKKTEESDASTQTAAIEPPKDPTAVTPQSATPPSVNIASPSTSPSGTPSAPPAEKTQTAAVADEASPSSASSWLTSLLGNVSGTSGANENKPSPADPSLSGAPNQTALSDQGVADQTSNGNTTNQTVLSETTNQTAPSSGGTLLSQSTDNVTAAEIAEADKYFGFTPSVRPRSNRTVTVQFMTSSHLKYPDGPFPGCSVPCAVYSAKSPKRNDKNAEVLMWHGVVGSKWSNVKNWGLEKPILPWQAKAFTGMESAVRTPVLQDYEKLFNLFNMSSSYIHHGDSWMSYLEPWMVAGMNSTPTPFAEKRDSIVFLNKNCGTASRREQYVRELMKRRKVKVDAVGTCLHNADFVRETDPKKKGPVNKRATFQRYKFCLVFENSITKDYVTEKLFEALDAGCIPLTNGPANIKEFLPLNDAAIDLALDAGGKLEVMESMVLQLMRDEQAYNHRLRWRTMEEKDLLPTWQNLLKRTREGYVMTQMPCNLCKHYANIFEPSLKDSDVRPERKVATLL